VTTVPTWPIAGASLIAGFAVADVTGVRPLGGLVLLAAAAWLVLRWRERAGTGRAVALLGLYGALFVVSHVLGDVLGTWGAVLTVAIVMTAATWRIVDRRELVKSPIGGTVEDRPVSGA
jgi:thiol:disulfide interchange protein